MFITPPATRYDWHFRLFRIPVRVSPWFWLVCLFLGWDDRAPFSLILVWMAAVFVSIVAHELGHALTARHFGAGAPSVILYGFGGLTMHTGRLVGRRRLLELLAGAGFGFVLAALATVAGGLSAGLGGVRLTTVFCHSLVYINIVWGVLNLMPVQPLDGGYIVAELCVMRWGLSGVVRSRNISFLSACVLAAGFAVWSLLGLVTGWSSWWLPAAFFAAMAYVNRKALDPAFGGAAENLIGEMHRDPWQKDPNWWKS